MLQIEFLFCKKSGQKKQKLFHIKFYFSGCVHLWDGRGRAVILKLNFSKSCDHKKFFIGKFDCSP
jgi:hypothetical protein